MTAQPWEAYLLVAALGGLVGLAETINLARTQIDLALVLKRQALLRPLVDKYPGLDELAGIAHNLIQERALFSQEQIGQMQKYVDSVQQDERLTEAVKRVTLVRFILDVGGPGYVQELIRGRRSGEEGSEA